MHALPPLGGVSGKCQNIVPNVGRRMFKVGLETVSKGLHLVAAANVSLLKQVPDVGRLQPRGNKWVQISNGSQPAGPRPD